MMNSVDAIMFVHKAANMRLVNRPYALSDNDATIPPLVATMGIFKY